MSRNFLVEALDRFAKVTTILVETSKIKEDLESERADLENICKRTETQVENLLEHAEGLKEFFSKREPDVNENSSEQNNCKDAAKPLIKLVDINKLVEPRVVKNTVNHSVKSRNFNDSIVIITSSDEDSSKSKSKSKKESTKARSNRTSDTEFVPHEKIKSPAPRMRATRTAAKKTIAKTKLALQVRTSSESDSESEAVAKPRRKINLDKKIALDALSNSSDLSEEETSSKKDSKLNSKAYVKLIRVPCENLKQYYLEKLDLLEVNKLTNLKTLKRKRRGSQDSGSSSKPKSKQANVEKSEEDSSDDSFLSAKQDEVVPEKSPAPPADVSEEMADNALELLNSDKEKENESSDNNEVEAEEKKKDEAETNKEGGTEKEKTDEKNETEKSVTEKVTSETDEPKENTNEENTQEADETDAEKKKEDNSEDDEKTKEDKKRKKWRNDKLLTAKLSSTDTEEEAEKVKKRMEKIRDDSSDDEPKLIAQDKKRRMKKRRMKKAILSDSDSDAKKNSDNNNESESKSSSSDSEDEKTKEEEEKEEELPKKKRRVKRVRDSSDDEDDEKSTRKQLRHILDRDSLAESTKKAEAEEKERKARIAEKQKKYNRSFEADPQLNATLDKVVLDYDEKNNKELLKVDEAIVSKLKPHQASGVQFMWDACFESLERAKKTKGSGCILAHCMGLGKTLQVIALSHTLLVNAEETQVRKILVVSPLSTVLNWVAEFKQWLPSEDDFEVFELVSVKQNSERHYLVKSWHTNGGVLIIGYDMFRNLSNPDNKRLSKKMRATFQEVLVDPGPDLIICDEGHLLKNEKTHLSIAMNRIRTLRRIILTGTPLQNNLKEYFCMVQFVKPNLLGTYKEYLNRFVNPITNGQYTDSTPHDIQVMRRRSHVLHKMLDGVVQRRDYSVLEPYLPPKFEFVLFLKLTEVQIKLYQHYMDHFAKRSTDGTNRTSFLFVDFQALQRICTHPRVLLDKSKEMKTARDKEDETDSEGSLKDFIDDDEEEGSTSSSSNSGSGSGSGSEGGREKSKSTLRKRVTRAAVATAKENGEVIDITPDEPPVEKEWWQEYCDGEELDVIGNSSKLFLLFEILKECEQMGDKVLVFSQSLYSLNIIEYFLGRIHDATQTGDLVDGYSDSWCLGLDYFRLDGSSSCDNRNSWCKTFNNPKNTRARLFLISTRAGGLGINLFAANRVVIFDVSWNPSHDIQSIYRVYRFGQTKPCYIYRFVTQGTMEMKIYERQVTKQAISKRVIDEQQIDRHYNQNDLAELYKFDPDPGDRPTPLVPKDVLLGELLQKYEDRIYSYHEHQTLLENKTDEGLNEEERKAAWDDFENEKKQRHNIGANAMRINNLELALINIIRKENPALTDVQVRSLVPGMHAQMQEQVTRGDLTLYRRIHQEMQVLVALQNQRLKEQFYQQQLQAMQHRQMIEAMKFGNTGLQDLLNAGQMPSTSQPNYSSGDVIELND